jgi:ATP-dependent Clp protease, protease subunit
VPDAGPTLTDDELLARREVRLDGAITERSAEIVIAKLLFLADRDRTTPVRLTIASPGGEVASALAIRDTITTLPCPVHTHAEHAEGVAVALLAHGARGQRSAGARARIAFVPLEPTRPTPDTDVARTRRTVHEMLASDTGRSVDAIAADERARRSFTAEQARDYGLVDRVVP